MTAILHTTELAHFASMTAFVVLAVTLIFGCFIIRFAPARRRASRIVGATRRRLSSPLPLRERSIRGGINCSATHPSSSTSRANEPTGSRPSVV